MNPRRLGVLVLVCAFLCGVGSILSLLDVVTHDKASWKGVVQGAGLLVSVALALIGYRLWKQPLRD